MAPQSRNKNKKTTHKYNVWVGEHLHNFENVKKASKFLNPWGLVFTVENYTVGHVPAKKVEGAPPINLSVSLPHNK